MNKVILTGNICREIELKTSSSGKEYLNNCIAVRREFKNSKGEYDSDFIGFIAWNAQAVYLSRYASKGDRVELVGRWEVEKYTDSNGTQQITSKCVVESVTAISKRKETAKEEEYTDGDLPF